MKCHNTCIPTPFDIIKTHVSATDLEHHADWHIVEPRVCMCAREHSEQHLHNLSLARVVAVCIKKARGFGPTECTVKTVQT